MTGRIQLALLLAALLLPGGSRAADRMERVTFRSADDSLSALLVKPAREAPHAVIVFVPGEGPFLKDALFDRESADLLGRAWRTAGDWHRFLEMGYACFAWDKPGLGESTGNWEQDSILDRQRELHAALDFLKSRDDIDPARIGLWGIGQAGWVMPVVAATRQDIAFMIAVSCPGQTRVRNAAHALRSDLRADGIDAARVEQALRLYERKWEMLRSGIPFTVLTRYVREKLAELGGLQHEWLAPWTLEDYRRLTADREALDTFFYHPGAHLSRLKLPILAVFGGRDAQVDPEAGFAAYHQAIEKGGNRRSQIWKFPEAGHVMSAGPVGAPAVPQYWAAVREFLNARDPGPPAGQPVLARSLTLAGGRVEIQLRFMDQEAAAYEVNLTSLTRGAFEYFTAMLGGPPLGEDGKPRARLSFEIRHGALSGKARADGLSLSIGPEKVFGFVDWRHLLIHEMFHLWNGETFRHADYREEWFNEGATEYVTLRAALKLGINRPDEGPFTLVRAWGNYNSARGVGQVSLREAGHPDRRQGYYFLLYHGGLSACTVLDYEIRRLTGNAKSFDDLLRYLYQRHRRPGRGYSAADLLKGLHAICGKDFSDFFRRYIHGTEIIPIGRYITRMEVEALRQGQDHKIPEPDRAILKGIFAR